MPFIPAANTARITLEFLISGKLVVNVIWAQHTTTILEADLLELAAAIVQWFDDSMQPKLSQDVSFVGITLRDMSVADGVAVEYQVVPALNGGSASPVLPNNVALATSFLTGLTGRSRRGRAFLAGLPEFSVTGNTVLASEVASITTAWAALKTAMLGVGFTHVVASLYTGGAPRVAALLTPVTSYRTSNIIDTQRRRLP